MAKWKQEQCPTCPHHVPGGGAVLPGYCSIVEEWRHGEPGCWAPTFLGRVTRQDCRDALAMQVDES